MIASLPMYDWPELRSDTDAYWQILHDSFAADGFEPPQVIFHTDDETEGWLSPDLFFSQTCGYPFVSRLEGKVELLGTPHFDIEGWQGPYYASALIVRVDVAGDSLDSLSGEGGPAASSMRFAFNSANSLSGYRCVTPLTGRLENYFGELIKSGGHRYSADMVADGRADIAAIDALCWHLYRQIQPNNAGKLRVLQWTPFLPGLPYITNTGWGANALQRLQSALAAGVEVMKSSKHNQLLRLDGVTYLAADKYGALRSL
ncbi:MAG: PhnD/SsuA/transferrin family substrate-binding protein [Rhizobiaceae bacterium]|nr:PhnD/SsuA/transferrin family substrate-binding protein [Hyphomicrobiales bacterium]NRB30415.1 PhnD/SsuA/transferrin family substrate-binding protein [Rhizobiaceae bacterium]